MAYPKHSDPGGSKMTTNNTKHNITNIAERLCENAAKIHYGFVSATLQIHENKIVNITHSTTETTKEKEKPNDT